MKKILIIITLSLGISGFAQQSNRFSEAEHTEAVDHTANLDPVEEAGPGNPGDPMPVDDYLPVLWAAAALLILYSRTRKIRLTK